MFMMRMIKLQHSFFGIGIQAQRRHKNKKVFHNFPVNTIGSSLLITIWRVLKMVRNYERIGIFPGVSRSVPESFEIRLQFSLLFIWCDTSTVGKSKQRWLVAWKLSSPSVPWQPLGLKEESLLVSSVSEQHDWLGSSEQHDWSVSSEQHDEISFSFELWLHRQPRNSYPALSQAQPLPLQGKIMWA